MKNYYLKALELAGYELEEGLTVEVQFQNMFIDCVDGGIYSDITSEEEALDFIADMGLEIVAKMMCRSMSRYIDHKKNTISYAKF